MTMATLSCLFDWRDVLVIVKPETLKHVLGWLYNEWRLEKEVA